MTGRLTVALGKFISSRQHGFLRGRSTTTNLVEFVSSVIIQMESGRQVDGLYLDFSKAFNCVNHRLLIEKLRDYGVPELADRKLQVRVGHHLSVPFTATSSVPQGSHLGPVLFLVYIQDLSAALTIIEFSPYADDLKLSSTVSSSVDYLRLQQSLNQVAAWGARNRNGLKLNADKCQVITFTSAAQRDVV